MGAVGFVGSRRGVTSTLFIPEVGNANRCHAQQNDNRGRSCHFKGCPGANRIKFVLQAPAQERQEEGAGKGHDQRQHKDCQIQMDATP